MTIHVFGDVHGDEAAMRKVILATLPGDTLVSVGDYGLSGDQTKWLEKHYSIRILVCRGNKENMKNPPDFQKPGSIVEVDGVRIGFVPGAASPNGFLHPRRKKHEMPVPIEWAGPVDVVISHDRHNDSALAANDSSFLTGTDRSRCQLSRDIVSHAVDTSGAELHIHGHYHTRLVEEYGGMTHVCMPLAETGETMKIKPR